MLNRVAMNLGKLEVKNRIRTHRPMFDFGTVAPGWIGSKPSTAMKGKAVLQVQETCYIVEACQSGNA